MNIKKEDSIPEKDPSASRISLKKMYGNPESLYSSDEASLFPLCTNISPEEYLAMEHYGRNSFNSSSSGLLRFRSAPSPFLGNFSSNGFAPNSALYPSSSVIQPINGGLDGGGYKAPFSIGMNSPELLRQNSFPTEFFSHPSGFAKMRAAGGSFRFGNEGAEHVISPSGIQSPSLGMLSRISEIEIGGDGSFNGTPPFNFPGNLTGLKTEMNDVYSLFPVSQVGEPRNQANSELSRQMSLPAEMASMEKVFQCPDPVRPKNIRAKRGCATHPRSIAERARRTRISERMKKLQELVPNMDKQTNTAGMLDLAFDYIKDLQMKYKILSDERANCKCSAGKHA